MDTFLNKGDKNVHAIALLYKKDNMFPELVLTSKMAVLNIDKEIKQLIKDNLLDLIVYARKSQYEHCAIFADLCSEYLNKPYILSEFDNSKTDRTLNRCSFDRNTFIPDKFKLGGATPGKENDCSGAHFLLESHLLQLTNPLLNKPFDDDNLEMNDIISLESDMPQCTSSFDASVYENLSDDLIEEQICKDTQAAHDNSCSSLDLGPNMGNVADELDKTNRRKRKISETVDYAGEFEWESTSHFK